MSGTPLKYRGNPGARIWPRLVQNGTCLEWNGSRNEHGYGVMTVNGCRKKAHRFAWELVYGPIPNGLDVLHRCDNPPCCNSKHLFLGTAKDNGQDMAAKGRHGSRTHLDRWLRGESHHQARLTAEQVNAIRARLRRESISALSRQYSVTRTTIRNIRDGKTWRHL